MLPILIKLAEAWGDHSLMSAIRLLILAAGTKSPPLTGRT